MSAPNRQTLINKVFKVLKSHYKPVKPPEDRSVLDHLLYACCLENASYEAADEAFAKLQQVYFDWNEVRVTTVTELAETLSCLPDPSAAATRLKRVLQSTFETHYAFDLEHLRKQNLGKAAKELESIQGTDVFMVAYVSQHGLGGHAIPCSHGVLGVFEALGGISSAEAAKQRVPGLERAIPKTKGVEFASLLHQIGAEFYADASASAVRAILTEISPAAKERHPKRIAREGNDSAPSQKPGAGSAPARGSEAKSPGHNKHPAQPEAESRSRKKSTGKSPPAAKASPPDADAKGAAAEAHGEVKKSPTKQLSRKKPR